MGISKTVTGLVILDFVFPIPIGSPFPFVLNVAYTWFPTAAPSARPNPVRRTVQVQVVSGQTIDTILNNVRTAIAQQEIAADGGGNTVAEDTQPPG